jgi:hypothetical protein
MKARTRARCFFGGIATLLVVAVTFALWRDAADQRLMAAAAGSAADITVNQPTWNASTGKVETTITLGKATADSIVFANGVASAANTVAKLTDLSNYNDVLQKGYAGQYTKTIQVVKDLLNYDELVKLSPPAVVQSVLGWMTGTLADAVDQNCLSQAVRAAQRNASGGVTIVHRTNFFTERSYFYNNGYYLYSQNEWSHSGCTEKKVCIQYLYDDGRNGRCW